MRRRSARCSRSQQLVFDAGTVPVPAFLGTRNVSVPLADLVPWIDWSPFFHTWELSGRYPAILDDPKKGDAARKVFADGRALLHRIVAERLLTARGTYGFFPARSTAGDEIVRVCAGPQPRARAVPMPRQQEDLIALVLLALSGTAVDRVIHAYVVPPPPRAERY
jgi:5-methyltetrahydrofolate--homocysteine methyltransferase